MERARSPVIPTRLRSGLPGVLAPMLASSGPLPADDGRWAYEVKWDGFRGLALLADGAVRVRSRHGHDLTPVFPELAAVPDQLQGRVALLDGEVIVADRASGRPDFARVSHRLGCTPLRAAQLSRAESATFVAFDLLQLDDRSLLEQPYADRRAASTPWTSPPARG